MPNTQVGTGLIRRGWRYISEPFRRSGRLDPLLVAILIVMHGLMLFNAVAHHPRVNYDGGGHVRYLVPLSELRLPAQGETKEFFSPPLPYALPAVVHAVGKGLGIDRPGEISADNEQTLSLGLAAKFYQLQNWLCSLVLVFFVLKLCLRVWPEEVLYRRAALALMAMMPVYYKTFAFPRGEPMLAMFAVIAIYSATCLVALQQYKFKYLAGLTISLAAAILSRQWGFFLFPAIGLLILIDLIHQRAGRGRRLVAASAIMLLALVLGGWFYASLHVRYGSITAFNREATMRWSPANQPLDFYFGLGGRDLVKRPFAYPYDHAFPNQFMPMFYTQFWGDYWGFWVVWGKNRQTGDYLRGTRIELALAENGGVPPEWLEVNRDQIMPYLGRVNLVSLAPTALLLIGVAGGLVSLIRCAGGKLTGPVLTRTLLFLVIACAFVGYFWFLIKYPNPSIDGQPPKGDTIKATYMLHTFPAVAILTAGSLCWLRSHSKWLFMAVVAVLLLVALHNLPMLVTRFIYLPI